MPLAREARRERYMMVKQREANHIFSLSLTLKEREKRKEMVMHTPRLMTSAPSHTLIYLYSFLLYGLYETTNQKSNVYNYFLLKYILERADVIRKLKINTQRASYLFRSLRSKFEVRIL